MKTDLSNSPFIVPEDFFDKVQSKASSSAASIIRKRRWAMGAVCTCLLAVAVIPAAVQRQKSQRDMLASNYEYQQSLDAYEYDVFLDNVSLSE